MTDAVMQDAQMGMIRIIRPFDGFEAVYQGQPGTVPIAFPGTLDPDAGKAGLATNLLAGIPVPLGSRVLLQIPMTAWEDEGVVTLVSEYEYQLVWRMRNQQTFNMAAQAGRQVAAYHLPSQALGRDQLAFVPGSIDVEIFEEDAPSSGAARLNVVPQRYRPKVVPEAWQQPLLPNGAEAAWQQGTYSAQGSTQSSGPTWVPLWLDAGGDELLILAYKINTDVPWDFTTYPGDLAFTNTYGTNDGTLKNNPNLGILVSIGTMGS